MPNWCENIVTFEGDYKDLQYIEDNFEFQKLRPCPLIDDRKKSRGESENQNEDEDECETEDGSKNEDECETGDESDTDSETDSEWNDRHHEGYEDWCRENWGVKWDINQDSLYIGTCEFVEGPFTFEFQTAWNPPCEIFRYLTEKMPSVSIVHRYFEPGMELVGECHISHGIMTDVDVNKVAFVRQYFDEDYKKRSSRRIL